MNVKDLYFDVLCENEDKDTVLSRIHLMQELRRFNRLIHALILSVACMSVHVS